MASKSGMGYSANDVPMMIERAEALCFGIDLNDFSHADWMLEGKMGGLSWITKNSGKEHFDGEWHNAVALHFDVLLPNLTRLSDEQNRICFDVVQKWCFAFRSGWLGSDPSPRYWLDTSRWVCAFTSWVYLNGDEFLPQEHGFDLVSEDDLRFLFEQLSIDGWVTALKIIERSFTVLYQLVYECLPSLDMLVELPKVPDKIVLDITNHLESGGLFVKSNPRDQRLICRKYLSETIGATVLRFNNLSVRKFLRQFECPGVKILTPSRAISHFQNAASTHSMENLVAQPPSKKAMALHSTHCMAFLAGNQIPSIGVPSNTFSLDSIKELKKKWTSSDHRALIPLNDAFAVLNEAACWITQYGDELLSLYEEYLTAHAEIDSTSIGRSRRYAQNRYRKAYRVACVNSQNRETEASIQHSVFSCLGLHSPLNGIGRRLISGNLSLSQAIFCLIGACAYAIGMMKPLRDDELASIPFECILRNSKTGGCFAEFPIEKSGKQGLKRNVIRPIPYFTYLAMQLMQRLACITAKVFSYGSTPLRLFYYPSGLGFDLPLKSDVSLSINRCMDMFCDYVDLPLSENLERKYFRIHELRKFFLLMLAWDDPEHGLECGAWMAGHRDHEYIQAYTDTTASGAEVTAWAAEQVEIKLLQMESMSATAQTLDDLSTLYAEVKADLHASSVTGLAKARFESYVKNALETGRYTVRLLRLQTPDGSESFDFGIFIKEANDAQVR